MLKRRPWREELAIIDDTMKAISGVTDPEKLVEIYYGGIGKLIAGNDYVSLSRRNVEKPYYFVTRSSRFTEDLNPFTQRDRLPKLTGGILGELVYANRPVIIEDLPSRLKPDDPGYYYLEGFEQLIALPQYDCGEGLNVTGLLFPPGFEIDQTMIPMMHWQAGLFGRGTTNLVLRNQLTSALAALDKELQVVGHIQRSLLPRELPDIPGFELATHYSTSARAGGDYYDFFPLHNGQWGFFIADVAGHGTPAAVLMAITHAIAHAQPGTHTPPAALLEYLNAQLAQAYTREGTFVTAFYAVLDPHSRKLVYSIAGHNPPRLVRKGGVVSLNENNALPLGILDGERYGQSTVTLEPGDMLVLYTDGITEAVAPRKSGAPRQLFGLERLDEVVLNCHAASAETCMQRVCKAIAEFSANAPPADDQTLIAMRCV